MKLPQIHHIILDKTIILTNLNFFVLPTHENGFGTDALVKIFNSKQFQSNIIDINITRPS